MIVGVDETKGPIIGVRDLDTAVGGIIINVVFIVVIIVVIIVVVVVVVVNCKGLTLSGLTHSPAVGRIVVCVDKTKGPIIGVRGFDTAVFITIIVK